MERTRAANSTGGFNNGWKGRSARLPHTTKRTTHTRLGPFHPLVVSLRLSRHDMLQVWRDAVVSHQTTLNSRQKLQYDRIVTACDAILYPRKQKGKQANPRV